MADRRFPPPWTFEEANGACFVVKDANGLAVSYVYYESEPGRRTAANLMTKDEAGDICAIGAQVGDGYERSDTRAGPTPIGWATWRRNRQARRRRTECGRRPPGVPSLSRNSPIGRSFRPS